MTKREKRLLRLRQNPIGISFDELQQVLEAEGFELDHASGSHYVFRAEVGADIIRVVIPFARPVKPIYVKQVLAAIDNVRESRLKLEESSKREANED